MIQTASKRSNDLPSEKVGLASIFAMAAVKVLLGAVSVTIHLNILPIVVDRVMPHSVNLGIGAGSGAFAVGQLFIIFCGRFSDDSMSPYGRRRPFIFFCAVILFIAFSLLWASDNFGWPVSFIMSYFLIGFGINFVATLSFSLLNDQLATDQIGMAGGIAALLDVCSMVITTILVLVIISDDATPYFFYVLCLIIVCCIPYLFISYISFFEGCQVINELALRPAGSFVFCTR